jgi:hypothetical protein
MKTTEQIVMSYAKNRAELKAVKAEIRGLLWPVDENGELIFAATVGRGLKEITEELFKDYFDTGDGGEPGGGPQWPAGGWVEVVEDSERTDPGLMRLAELWNLQKKINREAGKIKRAICARGVMLLRAEKSVHSLLGFISAK